MFILFYPTRTWVASISRVLHRGLLCGLIEGSSLACMSEDVLLQQLRVQTPGRPWIPTTDSRPPPVNRRHRRRFCTTADRPDRRATAPALVRGKCRASARCFPPLRDLRIGRRRRLVRWVGHLLRQPVGLVPPRPSALPGPTQLPFSR